MADSGLIGAAIGAGAALAGAFGGKIWDEWRQKRALRAAFRAEVSTILRGAETRGLEKMFRNYVDHWKKTHQEIAFTLWGNDEVKRPVFEANVGKIGSLGADVAEDIGMFYGLVNAIRIDLVAFQKGQLQALQPADRVAVVERSLAIWEDAKAIGSRLRVDL